MKTGKFKTKKEYYLEEAIRFLVKYMPREASNKKPVLLHCLRVGNYLLEKGCALDIVIGGYLHDIIEDSEVTLEQISDIFGQNVASIVLANSKDLLVDKKERLEDSIKRCNNYGIDALLVKSADIIDNYYFYKNLKDEGEMLRAITQGKYLLEKINKKIYQKHIIFRNLERII